MAKKKKRSRLVQRHMKAVELAKEYVKDDWFELYNALCDQPFKKRAKTAFQILLGKKMGAK